MRIIAFYLPQYHPIPENNNWWGQGFTEWVNVAKSRPRFRGHYQPHIPADLGFYDLRLNDTREGQAELAKLYGINGFCYYHYWFNGKMLLERPFNEVLNTGKPDFPFCICWANENWTRRWDGKDQQILIKQDYQNYDEEKHLLWLNRAFIDPRYIRINNKPIFLIYRPDKIPNIGKVIIKLKNTSQKIYNTDLYICAVKSWANTTVIDKRAIELGFDAIVDFQPNMNIDVKSNNINRLRNLPQKTINKIADYLLKDNDVIFSEYNIYEYDTIIKKWLECEPKEKEYPCVAPGWDNSPRKKKCSIIKNNTPEKYSFWLNAACKRVIGNEKDEQIVFINAWNEWGEGCHLEPDLKNGRAYLNATKEVLEKGSFLDYKK
jgi:lipopolysaccharide biosynthesis protein